MSGIGFFLLFFGVFVFNTYIYLRAYSKKQLGTLPKICSYVCSFLMGIFLFAFLLILKEANALPLPTFVIAIPLFAPFFHWRILKYLGGRKTSEESKLEEAQRIQRREAALEAQRLLQQQKEKQSS